MKIVFMGQEYVVTQASQDQMRAALADIVRKEYEKWDTATQLAAMLLARKYLHSLEKQWGQIARPPKKVDPVLFLVDFQTQLAFMMADMLTLGIAVDESSKSLTITGISPSGASEVGRQLADPGHAGKREDDVCKDAHAPALAPVS